MKAVYFEQFGDSGVLKIGERPTPKAQAGEVLIRIAHTSVNPVDWKIRKGYLAQMLPHIFPIIPGWDAAGEVVAVGEGANKFKVGEKVYAYARKPNVQEGTYAEFIALPETVVAKMPAGLSTAEAAGIPLVGLTAWQGLFDFSKLKAGQKLLVLGGAGGTGSLAIQLATAKGAQVTATASLANHDYVRSLGAEHVINYQDRSAARSELKRIAPQGFDVIFDAVGGDEQTFGWEFTKRGGYLVSIVDGPDTNIAKERGVTAGFHFVEPNGAQLKDIADLITARKVRAPATREMSVRDAAKALDENEGRRVRGKVALRIDL